MAIAEDEPVDIGLYQVRIFYVDTDYFDNFLFVDSDEAELFFENPEGLPPHYRKELRLVLPMNRLSC